MDFLIVLITDNTKESISFYKKNGMVDIGEYNSVAFVKYNLH